jgi:hypothetical protein
MSASLCHEISSLRREIHELIEIRKNEFECRKSHELITKQDLEKVKDKILSAIQDWAAKEQADLTAISASLDNVIAGIATLDALITGFQTSPGTLSTADQAALDAIQAVSKTLVVKASAISVTPPGTPTLQSVVAGITALDSLINTFQGTPGPLAPADQTALNAIQANSNTLVAANKATPPATLVDVVASVAAIDAQIAGLQASHGPLVPSDQTSLDAIQAASKALVIASTTAK